jgi:elongation factor Tu
MKIINARIKLFSGEGCRKTPFYSGYRPLFNFISESKASGEITLIDRERMLPNDEADVIIKFVSDQYLGKDFNTGIKFTFDEGKEILGEGFVLKVVE